MRHHRKVFGPDAHGDEDGDAFCGFGQAPFFGQCGKRQEAAASADEADQQNSNGERVAGWVGDRKRRGMRPISVYPSLKGGGQNLPSRRLGENL